MLPCRIVVYQYCNKVFRKSKSIVRFIFFVIIAGILVFSSIALTFNPTVSISPTLDISRFSPYKIIVTDVPEPENLVSLRANVSVIGGDGQNCWDYYVDGTCNSASANYNLTYDSDNNNWTTSNIYPDTIYPEIYFGPSSITWNNAPLTFPVRRGDYQIFHFSNPFSMVGDMSFWVEFNALPHAANSSNMEVFLVEKGKTSAFFQSDWRNSVDVELVGTFLNSATYHHQHHVVNSGHLLVPISTNGNGTVGTKSLDISSEFWIILYTQSPNVDRAWDMRYQPSSLCTNTNRWYRGNQSGWTITAQNGCPDAHIHIARKTTKMDGVQAIVTGTYNDAQVYTETDNFYFGDIPNLPPTGSSFLSPVIGTYTDNIEINWDPSTDANGSPLTYTIDLLNADGSLNSNLVTDTSDTTLIFDSNSVSNGEYSLEGEVCDDGAPLPGEPLCTSFELNYNFQINNSTPIYSLSLISITSTNDDEISKAGETITLSFTSTGDLVGPVVNFYLAGYDAVNSVTITEPTANNWEATFLVDAGDPTGTVSFDITDNVLDIQYIETTDTTYVNVDNTPPTNPVADPDSGTYIETATIELSSTGASQIRYTVNGASPTCASGSVYVTAITITESSTIRAIACDEIENASDVVAFAYIIEDEPVLTATSTPTPTATATVAPTATVANTHVPNTPIPTSTLVPSITGTNELNLTPTVSITITPTPEEGEYISKISKISGVKYLSEVRIQIVDRDNIPIPNIDITLHSDPKYGKTNSDGIVKFFNVPVGSHLLDIEYNNMVYNENVEIEDPNADTGEIVLPVIRVMIGEGIYTSKIPSSSNFSNSIAVLLLICLLLLAIVLVVVFVYRRRRMEQ